MKERGLKPETSTGSCPVEGMHSWNPSNPCRQGKTDIKTIMMMLMMTAVVFDCHFLFTDLTSLYTSLDFLSPAHCSMFLHCCSNHSCLSFLADVLISLHNFLYFLFISSDSFLFSFSFIFSFLIINFFSVFHSLLGRSTV